MSILGELHEEKMDIYAYGLIMYYIFSGRRGGKSLHLPFHGSDLYGMNGSSHVFTKACWCAAGNRGHSPFPDAHQQENDGFNVRLTNMDRSSTSELLVRTFGPNERPHDAFFEGMIIPSFAKGRHLL